MDEEINRAKKALWMHARSLKTLTQNINMDPDLWPSLRVPIVEEIRGLASKMEDEAANMGRS